MDNTSSTTHSTLHNGLVGILLTLNLHALINSDCAKPVVAVILTCCGLCMYVDSRNIFQKLLIQFLYVFMMCNVIICHRHLTAAYTSTNVTHAVIVAYLLMLIV